MFGKKKKINSSLSEQERKRLVLDLDYAVKYYNEHPDQIDFIIKTNAIFYNYLQKNWKEKWYCYKCRKWLSLKTTQCSCGQWQSIQAKWDFLLSQGNPKVEKYFSIISSKFTNVFSHLRFMTGDDNNIYFRLMDALCEQNESAVKSIMREIVELILRHLGIEKNIILVITVDDNNVKSGKAGLYTVDESGVKSISIQINYKYPPDTCIAIAAHECMHYFLMSNGVILQDTTENELLTDVAIVYCGMSPVMSIGYATYNDWTYENGVAVHKTNYRLGYITYEDLEYARALYAKMRAEYEAEQVNMLNKKMDLLKRAAEYNMSLFKAAQATLTSKVLTAEEFSILQKNAIFIQNNDISKILVVKEKTFDVNNTTTEKQIEKWNAELDNYLSEIAGYNKIINRLIIT